MYKRNLKGGEKFATKISQIPHVRGDFCDGSFRGDTGDKARESRFEARTSAVSGSRVGEPLAWLY